MLESNRVAYADIPPPPKPPEPACISDDKFTDRFIVLVLGLSIIALIMLLGLMNYYFLVQVFSGRFIAS